MPRVSRKRPWAVLTEEDVIVTRLETEEAARASAERIRENMRRYGSQVLMRVRYMPVSPPSSQAEPAKK